MTEEGTNCMTIEAKIQELVDQISQLDRFDREAILAIMRDHAAVVRAGPRIPMVVRLLDPGIMRIDTLRLFAAEFNVAENAVANLLRNTEAELRCRELLVCWTSYMQNRGTPAEPSYVIAVPDGAVSRML